MTDFSINSLNTYLKKISKNNTIFSNAEDYEFQVLEHFQDFVSKKWVIFCTKKTIFFFLNVYKKTIIANKWYIQIMT